MAWAASKQSLSLLTRIALDAERGAPPGMLLRMAESSGPLDEAESAVIHERLGGAGFRNRPGSRESPVSRRVSGVDR